MTKDKLRGDVGCAVLFLLAAIAVLAVILFMHVPVADERLDQIEQRLDALEDE